MSNKRLLKAFIRYDGSNRAVSSSLIWRKNKPKVGNWKEVQGYECCNGGGGGTVQLVVGDIELPLPYEEGVIGVEFSARCSSGPPFQYLKYVVQNTPPTVIDTYIDLINWLNTNFNYPGFTWLLTGPSTIEVVLDSGLLTGNCQNPNEIFFNWVQNTPP
jgi:hypothetical protein